MHSYISPLGRPQSKVLLGGYVPIKKIRRENLIRILLLSHKFERDKMFRDKGREVSSLIISSSFSS